ncbi:cutinase family protein [Corynebacterium cystitidis]|uniref:Cutinase n=1 Tax=Corynebacterium cystitidis DSM 20524 TaxID=1121357 RepID=A0A1H9VR99_9CORY|nr:cutinase family protein [Corynebacterium cystitidis]WJY82849.1 Cutinase [Corynebacterium cystitidis DSM 20524]SES23763.1 Cutinase [Corynebacterium cystitidis DSM 20524]SNV69822.1 Cutinase [Corynebacterium cystitidis]
MLSARTVIALGLSASLAQSLAVSQATTPAQAFEVSANCTPVHVLQAGGTGMSNRFHTAEPQPLFDNGYNPADELQIEFGARNVSGFNISYPSSLGAFSALHGDEFGYEMSTFGESRLAGVQTALDEVQMVAAHCPETKFIFAGYSQGAAVVGDVAALIANGEVTGITADDIAAVLLVADPGRARIDDHSNRPQPAKLYGPLPPGEMGANFEIINGGGTGVHGAREGMAGPRQRDFAELYGKVLSLCNAEDLSCSSPQDSLIRVLADYASRVDKDVPGDLESGPILKEFLSQVFAGVEVDEAAEAAGLTLAQLPAITHIIIELHEYGDLAYDHSGNGLDPAELFGLILIAALPNLMHEAVTAEYLGGILGAVADILAAASPEAAVWIRVVVDTLYALDAAETLYKDVSYAGHLPRITTATEMRQAAAHHATTVAMAAVAEVSGLDGALADPTHANTVLTAQLAGDFGPKHMSYYKGGYYIESLRGQDYAQQWLEAVTRGVLADD